MIIRATWPVRVLLLAACLALPTAAHAATVNGSVTLVGEPGDFIDDGHTDLFDQPGTLDISGSSTFVQVSTPVAPGEGDGYVLSFEAPSGSQLQPGEYDNAERWPFEPPGEPGLDVGGNFRGCDEDFGRFVVKDIHLTDGVPDRFWALYEQHCDNPNRPALFGEVRVGEPASTAPETVEPRAIDWPDTDVGTASTTVPVTIRAGESGAKIASAELQGTDAADFEIVSDACSGTDLAAGSSCVVNVRSTPTVPGDRAAQLVITDEANNATTVDLALLTQPDVTQISPDVGLGSGGTSVTISGHGLTGATGVKFGSAEASSFTVDSQNQITATTPAGRVPSSVGVEVAGAHGHSWAFDDWDFHYASPPEAPQSVTAQAGPGTGSTTVSFVPGGDRGSAIQSYTVTASPGDVEATSDTQPITVTGLDDVTTYTFTVTATNAVGTSAASSTSNVITTLRPTTTTAFAPPGSSVFGTPIDLTAAVSSTFSGTPTGTVDFSEDDFPLGSPVAIGADGHTTAPLEGIVDVDSSVTATYSGDSGFATSQGDVTPTVTPAHTSLDLTSSRNPVSPNADLEIDAAVNNVDTAVTPFGSVQFLVDGTPALDPIPLDDFGEAGIIAELPAGTYQIQALYHDDTADIPDFTDSSATLTQVVAPTPVVTTTPRPPRPPLPRPVVTSPRPNNAFFAGKPSTRAGVISLHVQSFDRGVVSFVARTVHRFRTRSHRAIVTYARGSRASNGGGTTTALTIRPNARARLLLSKKRRLKLRVTLTFRSSLGGPASHLVIPVTVTARKRHAAHRGPSRAVRGEHLSRRAAAERRFGRTGFAAEK